MLGPDDRRAIRDLVDSYAILVDSREYAAVARLFQPDGCLVAPDPPAHLGPTRALTGREAIERELGRLDGFALTVHGVLGLLTTSTGAATASGEVNAVAHHVRHRDDGAHDLVWHLRYSDRYARGDDGWRFARREIAVKVVDSRRVRQAAGAENGAESDGPSAAD
jgi:ketosteroid isomerase-like protein